ncbi:MAG TPA: GNAT family N-acetyltransferase [Azospirillaceae bacterium]|nr:GNAT family N-acetyltransferase [Azospirillaceae bacterium]
MRRIEISDAPDRGNAPDAVERFEPDGDAAEIAAVIHHAFSAYEGRLVPQPGALREDAASVAARLRTQTCFVVRRNGGIVGCAFAEQRGDALHLGRLAVRPEARGRGVAGTLIRRIEAEAREQGLARLTLGVRLALPDNIRLFERHGFRELAREAHAGFTEPTILQMEKRLA